MAAYSRLNLDKDIGKVGRTSASANQLGQTSAGPLDNGMGVASVLTINAVDTASGPSNHDLEGNRATNRVTDPAHLAVHGMDERGRGGRSLCYCGASYGSHFDDAGNWKVRHSFKPKAIGIESGDFLKITEEEEKLVEQLLEELDLTGWASVVPKVTEILRAVVSKSGEQALAEVGVTEDDITNQMDEQALRWAELRGAELVGMRIVDGLLVTNPNANWAITDGTRELLRGDVAQAVISGAAAADLAKTLVDNYAFSEARSTMIARTEIVRAHEKGNMVGWLESGVVVGVEWVLAGSHDFDDECNDNADDGEVAIGEPFTSGDTEPPAHPNCECALVPHTRESTTLDVDDEDEAEKFLKAAKAAQACDWFDGSPTPTEPRSWPYPFTGDSSYESSAMEKYSPDEARDERGKWTSIGAMHDALKDSPVRDDTKSTTLGQWNKHIAGTVKLYRAVKAATDPHKKVNVPRRYIENITHAGEAGTPGGPAHQSDLYGSKPYSVSDVLHIASDRIDDMRALGPTSPKGRLAGEYALTLLHLVIEQHAPGVTQKVAKGSPDQPRDDHGRWTSGGGWTGQGDEKELEGRLNILVAEHNALKDTSMRTADNATLRPEQLQLYENRLRSLYNRTAKLRQDFLAGHQELADASNKEALKTDHNWTKEPFPDSLTSLAAGERYLMAAHTELFALNRHIMFGRGLGRGDAEKLQKGSPDQPRDDRGRWTDGGDDNRTTPTSERGPKPDVTEHTGGLRLGEARNIKDLDGNRTPYDEHPILDEHGTEIGHVGIYYDPKDDPKTAHLRVAEVQPEHRGRSLVGVFRELKQRYPKVAHLKTERQTGAHRGFNDYNLKFAKAFNPDQPRDEKGRWEGGGGSLPVKASDYPRAGKVVDGLEVRDHVPNMSSIDGELTDYSLMSGVREVSFNYFEQPPSKSEENKQLAAAIKESGEINPLIVVVDAKGAYILEGSHRYSALQILGKTKFPAIVVVDDKAVPDFDDSDGKEMSKGFLPISPEAWDFLQKYSDDQPRDDRGRWTSGGGGDDKESDAMAARLSEMSPDKAEKERARLRAVHSRQADARRQARIEDKAKQRMRREDMQLWHERAVSDAQRRTPDEFKARRDQLFGDRPIALTGDVTQKFADEYIKGYDSLPENARVEIDHSMTTMVASGKSVTEAIPRLAGEQPRGWNKGDTFEKVSGVYSPSDRMAVVSNYESDGWRQTGGEDAPKVYSFGGVNDRVEGVVRHEAGHAYDASNDVLERTGEKEDNGNPIWRSRGWASDQQSFKDAYQKDRDALVKEHEGFYHVKEGVPESAPESEKWEAVPGETRLQQSRYAYYAQVDSRLRDPQSPGRQEAYAEVFAQMHGTGSTRTDILGKFPNYAERIREHIAKGEVKK